MDYDRELDDRVNNAHYILSELGFERVCALDPITPEVATEFHKAVDSAKSERPMQRFLWKHPEILARFLGPGFCWWIKQEVRLGNELRMDFLAARTESMFLNYTMVELEPPNERWFNPSDNKPARKMVESIQQVGEWRYWIEQNQDYAQRPKPKGLGLANLSRYSSHAQIILGRRRTVTDSDRERMNALKANGNIFTVNTYDTLIERSRKPVWNMYGQSGNDPCEECGYIVDL